MSEAGNTKHSARMDDALADEIDADEELELIEEPATPLPGSLTEAERIQRSELAIALRPGAFPADRGVLLQVARSEQANDHVIERLERLPIDTRFDTVQDVWEATGGHRELRDVSETVPSEVSAAVSTPSPASNNALSSVLMVAFGVVLEGVDLAISAVSAMARLARRGAHSG